MCDISGLKKKLVELEYILVSYRCENKNLLLMI